MLTSLSAAELARKLRAREVSAVEVVDAHLERIEKMDGELGAYLAVDAEGARKAASEAQARIDRGDAGALTGIPVAVKDNMSTSGLATTCASRILEGYVPPFDGTVVAKLREAGMPILGKTNLDEFAMGSSTETSAFQKTRNPWDLERTPGGSSGGSAAAVAGGLAPLSLGSDTGGSIRLPAALCGIVGFKPTYGRCSRYGLIAFGSSLDQIGPFGRTVEDVALLAEAMTGHDRMDSTSLPAAPISVAELKAGSLKGKRIALPKQVFSDSLHPGVRQALDAAMDALRAEGVAFEEVSIPSIDLGVTTYYIIAPAEASSNLARFDGIRYGPQAEGRGHVGMVERTRAQGFGREVKTRIMIGTYALSAGYYDAYYLRAQQVRQLMKREFDSVFATYDAVLTPTSPIPAFRLGEFQEDPMAMKLMDFCTIPANMGGMPGISIPCGLADELPVGLQLLAPPMADERLLQLAYLVEKALPELPRNPAA